MDPFESLDDVREACRMIANGTLPDPDVEPPAIAIKTTNPQQRAYVRDVLAPMIEMNSERIKETSNLEVQVQVLTMAVLYLADRVEKLTDENAFILKSQEVHATVINQQLRATEMLIDGVTRLTESKNDHP